jgi:ankyrin repeat protein
VEACDRGALPMVRLLLDAGADPIAGDPLMAAAHPGPHKTEPAMDVVALLLARGAPEDIFTQAALGRVDELRRLLPGADLNARRPGGGGSALARAAGNGHVEAVRLLLEAGADPHEADGRGQTIWQHVYLHIWGAPYRAVARLLLEHGVACTFHEACDIGHLPTVSRFLAEDPSLKDTPGPQGRLPVVTALVNADVDLARVLLAAGAADPRGQARALLEGSRREGEAFGGTLFQHCTFDRANFHATSLADTVFSDIDLSRARFNNVNLSGVVIESAFIRNLTIWGIDVVPLLLRERERRARGGGGEDD